MVGKKCQKGLTLPELMIGIALFAIVVSFAVPSFQSVMERQELNSKLSLLNTTLAYARAEAVTRAKNIIVCPVDTGESCKSGTDWSDGWLVFIDENDDRLLDAADTLIRKAGGAGGKVKMLADSTSPLIYNESGESEGRELKMCIPGADVSKSRVIAITNVGSSRVSKGSGC